VPRYLYACALGAAMTGLGLLTLFPDDTSEATSDTASASAASSGVAVLQGEIDAMTASGLPADHPKVAMLQEDLASFERGVGAAAPVDPGIDQVAGRIAAATRATGAEEAGLDNGRVDCEPLPGLLTAADVAGAECSSLVQPDGSNLYVAEHPDGTRIAVRFSPDGSLTVTPSP